MAHTAVQVDNFFAVQWGAPEPADLPKVLAAVSEQRERCGRPLAYVALMGGESARLSEEGRKTLMDLTDKVLPLCDKLVVVIEAEGFAASILRSALTAMSMVSGRRGILLYEADVDVALKKLAGSMTIDAPRARAAISDLRDKHARAA